MVRIVAEIGINHGGSADVARAMIDAAADAGADSVKFQLFDPARLISRAASPAGIHDFFNQFVLPRDAVKALKAHADARGVDFFAAPFDPDSLEFLVALGAQRIKIASGSLNDIFLLESAAAAGCEVILSTGMSSPDDIRRAVEILAPRVPLTLLHCVAVYPTPDAAANLRRMDALRAFGVPVGYSDHTPDSLASVMAAAMGASVIEKHFMTDSSAVDAAVSLDPAAFSRMVRDIRRAEAMLGDGVVEPRGDECAVAKSARMSLAARADVPAGTVLERRHLCAMRPGTGISPLDIASVIGKKTVEDLAAGAIIAHDKLK